MENYAEGDLKIEPEMANGALRLNWRGKSNARDPGSTLHPYFEKVAAEAATHQAAIEMRLNELDYFNSSTLAAIIRAVRRFREQSTPVRISYQEASGWQRRSCEALRVLEGDGSVEIYGE